MLHLQLDLRNMNEIFFINEYFNPLQIADMIGIYTCSLLEIAINSDQHKMCLIICFNRRQLSFSIRKILLIKLYSNCYFFIASSSIFQTSTAIQSKVKTLSWNTNQTLLEFQREQLESLSKKYIKPFAKNKSAIKKC